MLVGMSTAKNLGTDIRPHPRAHGRLLNGRLGSGWNPGVECDMVFLYQDGPSGRRAAAAGGAVLLEHKTHTKLGPRTQAGPQPPV